MILCLNIDNSRVTAALFEGEQLRCTVPLAADAGRTADEYAVMLRGGLELRGVGSTHITGAILSSAVPNMTASVAGAVSLFCGVRPLIVGPGVRSGLNIRTENPSELGADLVALSVGALSRFAPPILLCDFGTATTISLLDSAGCFAGTMIASGVETSLAALRGACAQLPAVGVQAPGRLFGRNTPESMRSGALCGAAAMVDGVCARAAAEQGPGQELTVLMTGTLAPLVAPLCTCGAELAENLIFYGLREIYRKNTKEAPAR